MAKPIIVTRDGKGSALTWEEGDANFTNLQNSTITLSSGLDAFTYDLNSTIEFSYSGNASVYVNPTNGIVTISSSGINALINDTTPSLGGDLITNGHNISAGYDLNLHIYTAGAGNTFINGYQFPTSIEQVPITGSVVGIILGPPDEIIFSNGPVSVNNIIYFYGTGVTSIGLVENTNYKILSFGMMGYTISDASDILDTPMTLTDPGIVANINFSIVPPAPTMPLDGQVLTTNASGVLTWTTPAGGGGIASVSADSNPMLGGNLDVDTYSIISTNNQNISIVPNGSGNILLTPDSGYITLGLSNWPTDTGTANQVLTTDGAGNLSFTTPSTTATVVQDYVMNQTGTTIPKGSVVYISGANGTNPLITLSQANTEMGSSKTLGFTTTAITQGSTGYVITNGLLEGVNTDTATIGDPVWLSSTTAGGMVFGTANRPVAPNHTVYLGVVVRVNQNNGAIVVKVQNGYELYELHNVSNVTPSDNDVLTYVSSTGLWTPAAGGGGGGGSGTVTSVGGTGTVNGLTLTGTVTTSGDLTLGGTLSLVSPPAIGSTTANTGAFTTLSASSTVSGTGFSTYLASPPAIGGTTAAAISATTLTFKDTREAVFGLGTTGGTIAPNCANGTVQSITLNAALTINAFTTPIAGQSLTLIIYGGTAYTGITSTMKFAGGVKTLTATAGCIDILTVYYDGTNYFASLGKGFA